MELELLQPWTRQRPRWYPTWVIANCRRMAAELANPPVVYQERARSAGRDSATQTPPRLNPPRYTVTTQTASPLTASVATQTDVGLARDPDFLLRLLVDGSPSEESSSSVTSLDEDRAQLATFVQEWCGVQGGRIEEMDVSQYS